MGIFSKAMAGASTSRDTTDEHRAMVEKREWFNSNPQTRVVHLRNDREEVGDKRKRGTKDKVDDEDKDKDMAGYFATKTKPVIYWKPLSEEEAKRNDRFLDNICFAFRDKGECRRGSTCRFEHVRKKEKEELSAKIKDDSGGGGSSSSSSSSSGGGGKAKENSNDDHDNNDNDNDNDNAKEN